MSRKTSQLQIRVSPEEKATLKRLAAEAGLKVSQYVLSQVLPASQAEFARLAGDLAGYRTRRTALMTLLEYLSGLSTGDLKRAVSDIDLSALPPVPRNYVAAAVEQEARVRGIAPPAWALDVPPLAHPHFGWEPGSLRPHLMRLTPVSFKRRNVFEDAAGVETDGGRRGP